MFAVFVAAFIVIYTDAIRGCIALVQARATTTKYAVNKYGRSICQHIWEYLSACISMYVCIYKNRNVCMYIMKPQCEIFYAGRYIYIYMEGMLLVLVCTSMYIYVYVLMYIDTCIISLALFVT